MLEAFGATLWCTLGLALRDWLFFLFVILGLVLIIRAELTRSRCLIMAGIAGSVAGCAWMCLKARRPQGMDTEENTGLISDAVKGVHRNLRPFTTGRQPSLIVTTRRANMALQKIITSHAWPKFIRGVTSRVSAKIDWIPSHQGLFPSPTLKLMGTLNKKCCSSAAFTWYHLDTAATHHSSSMRVVWLFYG